MEPRKLTLRQENKLLKLRLADHLETEQAFLAANEALSLRIRDLEEHSASQQELILELSGTCTHSEGIIAELRSHIAFLEQDNSSLRTMADQQHGLIDELTSQTKADSLLLAKQAKELEKIEGLRHSRKVLARELYGRKSERMNRNAMIREGLQAMDLSEDELMAAHAEYLKHGYVNIVREEIPGIREQGLPVKTFHKVPDNLPEGARCVGANTSYKLVYHKAWTEIHETVHHIFLIEDKENITFKNVSGKLEPRPMKCMADVSVLVQLLMDKYQYHLPVYRQLSRFAQAGVRLKESTVYDWSNKTIRLLKPIYDLMVRLKPG